MNQDLGMLALWAVAAVFMIIVEIILIVANLK